MRSKSEPAIGTSPAFLSWFTAASHVAIMLGPEVWIFFHARGGTGYNGIAATDVKSFLGQHRAWSDGSVEWLNPSDIDLAAAHMETTTSYKIGVPGYYWTYYWF